MIRTGDSIANPVTGETVTFQQTSADSDGEVVIAEVMLEPGGSVAGVHVHPNQTETSGSSTARWDSESVADDWSQRQARPWS